MDNNVKSGKIRKRHSIRWLLVLYDFIIVVATCMVMLVLYKGTKGMEGFMILNHTALIAAVCFLSRLFIGIYSQIWRYGGIQVYIKLVIADIFSFLAYYLIQRFVPDSIFLQIPFPTCLALIALICLLCLTMRMFYRYAYKMAGTNNARGRILGALLILFSFGKTMPNKKSDDNKIKIAIVGAGNIGSELAEDLLSSSTSSYTPRIFIDSAKDKIGRQIHELPVYGDEDITLDLLRHYSIQEIVFAIPTATSEKKKELYEKYRSFGMKTKVYDYPTLETTGKRRMREFDIEELLFRPALNVNDEKTAAFYNNKCVLITGGGGSIGSELCRRVAKMGPSRIVILDVYENGAYDVQQELRRAYSNSFDIRVEICSVCNKVALERAFRKFRPQIVIMAAAHKHVPLMEDDCIEAVENNVFGTLNTVEVSEKFGVERVIMVSTDKAVNPTNVMGATKRMCEMIVQAHSASGKTNTTFSATRFGNVLGSAGSVIPLFRSQIAHGGPVTVTDMRIIRYFMTIPEASQLVLQSGAMAQNGELFVLDMGKPIKIYDLAENMIRLSGMEPGVDIKIMETGLRPGEKLYEELLVKTEELDKTDNELIFIERDSALSLKEIDEKLDILRKAIESDDEGAVKAAMKKVVPTFRNPEDINGNIGK